MADSTLRILQIGAGSMGTRRLRDLSRRQDVALAVFDVRTDRRNDAGAMFRIPAFGTLEEALAWEPQALSISTPPDAHASYVRLALDRQLHHFCEANIWTPRLWLLPEIGEVISAPSCTFYFHPLVTTLKQLVRESLGKLHTWQFCLSTYMPNWHPEEGDEFYARRRSTAAAREMVPFELLWLNEVFGDATKLSGMVRQLATLGEELEDTWCLQIELSNGAIGQLSVLMGCPTSCRRGWCLGENGIFDFDLWHGVLNCHLNGAEDFSRRFGPQNELIEHMYEREINTFVDSIRGKERWPLSYYDASLATSMLAATELSSLLTTQVKVDVDRQPAALPNGYLSHDLDLDQGSRLETGQAFVAADLGSLEATNGKLK